MSGLLHPIFFKKGSKSSKVDILLHFSFFHPPGARFSKVRIINGHVKLFWFTCKIEASIVLHLT